MPENDKVPSDKQPSKATKKGRRTPLFPATPFEEALVIANAIQKHASGQRVRRLTLFDAMGKSPDSGTSRQLVTNSGRYGITSGGYQAEFLELTPEGRTATSSESSPRERLRARFRLAIESVDVFRALFEKQVGQRLPSNAVLEDLVRENGIPVEEAAECVEMFIVNAKFVGVLKPIAGADRFVSVDQAIDELPPTSFDGVSNDHDHAKPIVSLVSAAGEDTPDWDKVCFYISPIGEDGSEHRKHADLFLGAIVEPAVEELGLKVVRADKIGKPGMITGQILDHVVNAKLVVADLSFHNPNVFYELCLRHVCRKATVQIIRKADKIPFDLDQFRTIRIDTTDIYSLVPNLQSYKAEIATQVRAALKDPEAVDNPLSGLPLSLFASQQRAAI